jgi:hypothetical protein
MSETVSTKAPRTRASATTPNGEKKARAPSKPHAVLIALQVLDEQGQPMPFPKERIRVLKFGNGNHSSGALSVIDAMETAPHSFYIKGELPAAR